MDSKRKWLKVIYLSSASGMKPALRDALYKARTDAEMGANAESKGVFGELWYTMAVERLRSENPEAQRWLDQALA